MLWRAMRRMVPAVERVAQTVMEREARRLAFPKPAPRRRAKRRRDAEERRVKRDVRKIVVRRDGYCRLGKRAPTDCLGPSQWAHLPDLRRARTVGQRPERRHTSAGTLMLCQRHHDELDGRARPRLQIEPQSRCGANGRLHFVVGEWGWHWTEEA